MARLKETRLSKSFLTIPPKSTPAYLKSFSAAVTSNAISSSSSGEAIFLRPTEPAPPPTEAELVGVLDRIYARMLASTRRQGLTKRPSLAGGRSLPACY